MEIFKIISKSKLQRGLQHEKIIILGGGPAGLTAAYELLKDTENEYDVTILEESGVLGGISQTVRYHGNRMDIGGHRFFSKDDTVMQWWADLMPIQGAPSYDDKKLGREKPWKRRPRSGKGRRGHAGA